MRGFFLLGLSFAAAYDNGMARRPPMGWNSWCTDSLCNALGHDPCSESLVKSVVDGMVEQGMPALGYNYVTLDDCWSATTRDADGALQPEPSAFPNGIGPVADYVHSKGLLFGLYLCVGTVTCKGHRPGSFGHYEQDARTVASWGVDFVKMDHCGFPKEGNHTDQELYGQMSAALNATGRPITFSLCQWGEHSVFEWGHQIAQMFRISMDHLPLWRAPGRSAGAGFGQGTSQVIEYMASLVPSKWTRQYGWLDPDFLMTLYWPTMDLVDSRTEFSFWSIWSAPLLVSTDVRHLSDEKRSILTNAEVIAIDQDASFTSADRIRKDADGMQLWSRPLHGGDIAVILYNSGDSTNLNGSVAWSELGWSSNDTVRVRDLWARHDVGELRGGYTASELAPHDVAFLRLSRAARPADEPTYRLN